MKRDASMGKGGEQAAWRDLVARLELPSAVDPANAPWPDRENLSPASPKKVTSQPGAEAASGSGGPSPASGSGGPSPASGSGGPSPASGSGGPSPASGSGGPSPASGSAGSPATRSRIVRPATFLRSSAPADGDGRADVSDLPPAGQPGNDDGAELAGSYSMWDSGGDCPEPDYADQDLFDGPDDRYIPPPVPALPRLDPVAKGAWTALFGGPAFLFLATLLGWQLPGWAELGAIIAFVAGFVVLVSRLGDGPSRRDGPDQGAVV